METTLFIIAVILFILICIGSVVSIFIRWFRAKSYDAYWDQRDSE